MAASSKPSRLVTTRFSDRVADYILARPTYPAEVINVLAQETGLTPAWTIADIGSGTGISAELFLRNGSRVMGVEPNAPMRNAAEKLLAAYPSFTSVAGSAESTTLGDASIDCVVAAQAFHWFDVSRARSEFLRILRRPAWLVVLWNNRRLDATPFLAGYEALLNEFGSDYATVRHDRVGIEKLAAMFGDAGYHRRAVENLQRLDHDGLRARLLSSSYVPAHGEPRHEEMLHRLDDLFAAHQRDGVVTIEYDAEIYFGRLE